MELSITGKKAKWYTRHWWNKSDDLNQLGVKVAENEYYTEYAVHYMVRNKNPSKPKLTEEEIEEGEALIKERENTLKEIREIKLFKNL
jgi:HD superfamily phosphohydrolase